MVICLEQGADLHTAQPMPLPLTVSCSSKIQIGFTFLVLAHQVILDKGPLNGCVCVFVLIMPLSADSIRNPDQLMSKSVTICDTVPHILNQVTNNSVGSQH